MPAKKKRVPATPAPAAKKKPPAKSPAAESAASEKLSALNAAALVLRASGQPMSCAELIAQMAAKGYWTSPKGKTPASTLYAAMAREAKLKGAASRFEKTGPGRFAYRPDAERSLHSTARSLSRAAAS